MRIKILIRLKSQILEPQGKVIEQSLNNLGFNEFNNIENALKNASNKYQKRSQKGTRDSLHVSPKTIKNGALGAQGSI